MLQESRDSVTRTRLLEAGTAELVVAHSVKRRSIFTFHADQEQSEALGAVLRREDFVFAQTDLPGSGRIAFDLDEMQRAVGMERLDVIPQSALCRAVAAASTQTTWYRICVSPPHGHDVPLRPEISAKQLKIALRRVSLHCAVYSKNLGV